MKSPVYKVLLRPPKGIRHRVTRSLPDDPGFIGEGDVAKWYTIDGVRYLHLEVSRPTSRWSAGKLVTVTEPEHIWYEVEDPARRDGGSRISRRAGLAKERNDD